MSSDFSCSSSSSRWLTEEVFKLIDNVQHDEAIYNPRHKYYFCRPYVENFWREVDLKLEKNPGASLAKWTNLRISFRREYTNYLEEKVPPCWSYFDRMFFLHPFLRKKHQQSKSLDSQVQDALVQISSLSNRLQRERAVAAHVAAHASKTPPALLNLQSQQQPLDNYLDYFDEEEPETNSDLDEIIADEEQSRFPHLDNHDIIKSEHIDEYDEDALVEQQQRNVLQEVDDIDDDEEHEDMAMRNFVLNSLTNSTTTNSNSVSTQGKRQQLRLLHLNRLQTRSYHEDLRAKRPRSQESSCSSTNQAHLHVQPRLNSSANGTASTSAHSNVSFVRPTFAKPMELVSTTTSNVHAPNDNELGSSTANATAVAIQPQPSSSLMSHSQQRLLPHQNTSHRLEIAAVSSVGIVGGTIGSANNIANTTASSATPLSTTNNNAISNTAQHVELCDCKSDPDAMFLMSLLPDIQKLNGRDRGKIKIAFQNILQDYLYPD